MRATQFHNLLEMLFRAQRFSPVVLAPSITLQPIALEDIADRLVATLLFLQSRGRVTAEEVAEELEVSIRTARRDLEALSIAVERSSTPTTRSRNIFRVRQNMPMR